MSEYGNNSIRRKRGEDRVRDRPEALLGSNGLDGAKHTVTEMLGNLTDEHLAGYGNKAILYKYEDGSIAVRDYGRGVPLGWNDVEKEWNYFLIYEDLYAGGKYDNMQEILEKIESEGGWESFDIRDYPYLISIGLNGLGAAATQYSSEFFTVVSYRGGKACEMQFRKGKHIWDKLKVYSTEEEDGTYVHWKPDIEVFFNVDIPSKWLDSQARNLSLVSNMDVIFNNKGKEYVYNSKSLEEVMQEATGNALTSRNFVHVRDSRNDICICQAEVVLGSAGYGVTTFHNMVEMRGGVHSASFNAVLADFFREISSEKGVKIRDVDYAGKFSVLMSTLSNKMSLRGQTKDHLDDDYILNCLYDCMYESLKMAYQKSTPWVMEIVDSVVDNAYNRIAVAEMSKNLKEVEKATKKHKLSDKFSPSESYLNGDAEATEVFIVEGDSAGGRAETARSYKYQCIMPIRGKSLNVYKAPIDKIIANAEIRDMIAAFGCGIDLGIDGYESFDITKLKVGKIFLMADADIDGKHINMLLFLIIYRLFPELLYQGKVYIVYSPLFVVETRSEGLVYCRSEEELDREIKRLGSDYIRFDRMKGLGETDAEVLWETSLNPETRVCRQLKIDRNDMEMQDVLEVLFGTSTARRKRAILGSMMPDFDEVVENIDSLSKYVEGLGLNSNLDVEEVEV